MHSPFLPHSLLKLGRVVPTQQTGANPEKVYANPVKVYCEGLLPRCECSLCNFLKSLDLDLDPLLPPHQKNLCPGVVQQDHDTLSQDNQTHHKTLAAPKSEK